MNIIELAREAGFGPVTIAVLEFEDKRLTRFATLVRNATLEEAAMLAYQYPAPDPGGSMRESIAAAIRRLKGISSLT